MSRERTVTNLSEIKPLYTDSYRWAFYEGGQSTEQVVHEVDLTITKSSDDKIATIMIALRLHERDANKLVFRLSPYEFDQLNSLFKRASFRLEKV